MSTGHVSKTMMDDVERCLSSAFGMAPIVIHERLGMWSPVSVRHALRQLLEEGRVSFTGPNNRRLYRRPSL